LTEREWIVLENLTYATFSAHLGETFQVHRGSADAIAVELIQATDRGRSAPAEDQAVAVPQESESFSIIFLGPPDRMLSQGTYRFEHAHIGSFPLFVVPIGTANGRIQYEAVFNRMPHK
jgi:hypothetical protein